MGNFKVFLLLMTLAVGLSPAVTEASLMDGLIGYYAFNPGQPIGQDSSGNGHDGTVGGSPQPTNTADMLCNPTAAGHFPLGGYISVPDIVGYDLESYSITTWFKFDDLGESRILVYRGPSGQCVSSVGITAQGDDLVAEHEPDGESAETIRIDDILTPNRWYGTAFTYDAISKEMKLYLAACDVMVAERDGVDGYNVRGNIVCPDLPSQNYPLVLGANGEHDGFFGGSLDEVRLYNRALSEQEVVCLIGGCVPEPASLLLLGFGALGVRRRKGQ